MHQTTGCTLSHSSHLENRSQTGDRSGLTPVDSPAHAARPLVTGAGFVNQDIEIEDKISGEQPPVLEVLRDHSSVSMSAIKVVEQIPGPQSVATRRAHANHGVAVTQPRHAQSVVAAPCN